jgi:hypothetical protein
MWEQGARRRARLLFAALCVSVTLIHGYAFNRYTSDLHGRTRNASDWLETLVRFTPFFGAVHGISYVAYARLIGDAASSSKKTSPHWFASHVVSMAHAIVGERARGRAHAIEARGTRTYIYRDNPE